MDVKKRRLLADISDWKLSKVDSDTRWPPGLHFMTVHPVAFLFLYLKDIYFNGTRTLQKIYS